ncbi:hypothetical protein Slin15195_G036660 [Septoria linicola]|uniref:Uncharacterized protein n=1 Tax=Septoria linicola TaxID=215465 RepID=A0A9Q9AJ89_9PEZI|nr:hypothetical protein Slin15195_G036660 [Septoria linicola]
MDHSQSSLAITTWAECQRHAPYRENVEHQQSIGIVESLLLGSISAYEAATSITKTYDPFADQTGYGIIGVFWSIFSNATRMLAGDTVLAQVLADFVIAMQALPDAVDTHGRTIALVGGAVYWRDLPGFGVAFREYGLYVDGPDDNDDDFIGYIAQTTLFVNATTFAAELLVRAPFEVHMDFYALNALMTALRRDETVDSTDERQAEVSLYLPAAARWIEIAGGSLYSLCQRKSGEGQGGKRLSLGQWEYWKERFAIISESGGFSDDQKTLAKEAYEKMSALEHIGP